jgi:type I restriction enzyme M protein
MSKRDLFSDIWRAANIMRTDDGTNGIYQYIEQISWMFFLKVFEDLEDRFEAEHELESKIYDRLIPKEYSWSQWTKIDYKKQEILEFIDKKLFPFLASLEGTPERNTIGSIFSEVKNNKMTSSYNLKDVIDIIDEINFNNPEDSHILSRFYEDLLVKLGRESGIAGEIYTPRPIVRLMVKIVDPKLNLSNRRTSTILDPFCGSCGFLIESYKHMIEEENVTAKDYRELQRRVFHGAEKKSLPFLVGVMNCILHGLLAPNIIRKNSLNENIDNFGPGDTFDYIFTNPPFGAKEGKNIQENFPVKIRKTELLALQSVMRRLNYGGKCAIVVPEPILWRSDKYLKVRKDLLNNYNIHTIISLPAGVFANVTSSGLGPKTNLLFFEKQGITKEIWYYELTPPRSS